jgi:hypothetical protein
MDSVANQDYTGPIEHVIVGDGCDALRAQADFVGSYYQLGGSDIDTVILRGERDLERYLWERVASHMNQAVAASSGAYIAVLDDDNTIAANHLSSLEAKITEGYDAVHSWRNMYYADGTPFLMEWWPWMTSDDSQREELLLKAHRDAGVYVPGHNVTYDTLCMTYKGQEVCGTIDASEWMYRKSLFTNGSLRFVDDYSFEDLMFGHFNDYLLNKRIRHLGLKVACTELPTLNYFLSETASGAETCSRE